jgi:hypothetical protein
MLLAVLQYKSLCTYHHMQFADDHDTEYTASFYTNRCSYKVNWCFIKIFKTKRSHFSGRASEVSVDN